MAVLSKIVMGSCVALPIAALVGFAVAEGALTGPWAYVGAAAGGWAVTALLTVIISRRALESALARLSALLHAATRGEVTDLSTDLSTVLAVRPTGLTDSADPADPANQAGETGLAGRDEFYRALHGFMLKARRESGLLHGVFAGLPMPYLLVDAHEKTISTNQFLLDMVEIDGSIESCLGRTLADLFYNDPGRETAVGKCIHTGEHFSNLELVITGHKGRRIDVLANVYPVYDQHNVCVGGLCIYVDMTKQRDAEKAVHDKSERMLAVALSLADTINSVSSLSSNIRSGFDEAGHCAAESSACVGEATEVMDRMSSMLRDAARNADAASATSALTKEKADAGAGIVESSLRSISAVRDVSLALKEDMTLLDEHARSISRVMNVISDIADQTNLLALNAAIEAARAGDAGRGFAVVADEVRKLAEKTMASTHDVAEAIKAIQESAGKSAASVDTAVARIEEATEAAGRSGEALRDIVHVVEQTAVEVNAIAEGGTAQAAAGDSVNGALRRVNEMAETASEALGGVDKEITTLGELVAGLEESMKLLRS